MNRRASWRDVDGILLLDKPEGISSNRALQQARSLYQARKAGHTGSLDPFATGMLAVCFGQATKVCSFLLDASKTYRVRCRLGVRTETGDPEGDVVEERPVPRLGPGTVEVALAEFTGEIEQVPPMHSALKHEGRRLYQLARKGVSVEREPRRVTIHGLSLEDLDGDRLELEVHCSKGTYIRVLVEDLARRLGTVGHAAALRRSGIHPFEGRPMQTLDELSGLDAAARDGLLLAPDEALVDLPAVELGDEDSVRLGNGQAVAVEASARPGAVRVYAPCRRFLGIGELSEQGGLRPRRMMAVD